MMIDILHVRLEKWINSYIYSKLNFVLNLVKEVLEKNS